MKQNASKIDRASVELATARAKDYVAATAELCRKFIEDPEREVRVAKCYCISCHYMRHLGGASMTIRPCGLCGEDHVYGSTYTDALCKPCALKNGLCKHCGGDVEMKNRRKPYPFQDDPLGSHDSCGGADAKSDSES